MTVTLGANYDFEVAKVYFGAQYFDEVKASTLGGIIGTAGLEVITDKGDPAYEHNHGDAADLKLTGYGVGLSASMPLAGGKGMFGVAYVDAEQSDWQEKNTTFNEFDFTRWIVTAGYDYPFSKRTDAYAIVSYMDDEIEAKGDYTGSVNPTAITAFVGLRHRF